MAANANTRASFNISANCMYKSGNSNAGIPGSLGPRVTSLAVTGSGAKVATKSFPNLGILIQPSATYTLDLSSFVDALLVGTSWTNLRLLMIEHNFASLATGGIDITGAQGNAIPSLRGSKLLPGEGCIPYYSVTTKGPGTVGITVTAPNSHLIIQNLDAANVATVDILVMGN